MHKPLHNLDEVNTSQEIIQTLQKEVERLRECVAAEQREKKEQLLPLLAATEDKVLIAEAVATKERGDGQEPSRSRFQ